MSSIPSPYGKGLVGLLKRGWHEIPAVMGSSVLMLVGIGLGAVSIYSMTKNNHEEKKYKYEYIVMRSDDPRVLKRHPSQISERPLAL